MNYQEKTKNKDVAVQVKVPGIVFVCTKRGLDFIGRTHPRIRSLCIGVNEIEREYAGLKNRGFPCLLLAVSPDEAQSLEATISSIPDFSAINPKCLMIGGTSDAVEVLMLAALMEVENQRRDLLKSLWDVNKSLAILRLDYEKVIENFSIASQSLGAVSTPGIYLSHSIEPEPSRISSAGNGFGLAQRVSVLPRGLMCIEFHISQQTAEARGELKVRYFEGYDSVPRFSWARESDKLHPGWNRFSLERSSISDEPIIRVEIEWSGAAEDAPFLSLGPASPFDTINVSLVPDTVLNAPLAMRVMSGLPGIVPPRFASGSVAAKWRPSRTEVRTLVWQDVKKIRQRGSPAADPGFKLVEAREKFKDILLHTQDTQATIGVIEDLPINDIRGLHCLVHLSHKDASPTEFAAMVRPSHRRGDEPVFSKWLRVEPLGWGQVVTSLDEPITGNCDFYLATRPLQGRSSSLGWATIKRIDIVAGSEG